MSQVKTYSNVSHPNSNYGPEALWEVGVLGSLYSAVLICSILFNSAVLHTLVSLSKSGWTVVNQLIAWHSFIGITAVTIAVPLYLHILITGDRNPILCGFYAFYTYSFSSLSYSFFLALGFLRYGYVFHFRQLQHLQQKTIMAMPFAFAFLTTTVHITIQFWVEPPLDRNIRSTLCATQFTTYFKNDWRLILSPHLINAILGLAYLRILHKIRSLQPVFGEPLVSLKRVNFVDARISALTVIILESSCFMVQIWNFVDPSILTSQHQFFLQEIAAQFIFAIHFVPALLYSVSHEGFLRSVRIGFTRTVNRIEPIIAHNGKIENSST